ncbi:hypothetical protein HYALB_00011326 [Hymenoscyphus albidus]|uniref:Uncharacterized protein n=1 Tax=Hymenoscyphus albidus TaxID=595503 RepID=A0A9N9LKM2_9HELO|nr:hypothetical protein HYALB_00011326 [Hymenoscyphus albidus]
MTPLNPPSYNWTSPHPGIYHRPALSTESLWFTRPKDLHEMFITSHLTFSRPHTHYPKIRLKEAARRAWKRLRFEVPELGIRAVINDGEVFLEYKMLDEVGVRGWISRTLFFGESEGDYEFESLRKDIVSRKDCEEQASVLLNFETRDSAVFGDRGEELVDGVYLILNTDHQITDGIGTRILLGRFLELFSQYVRVEMDCKENLVWEDSYKNLTQPWIGMLDGMQKLEGRKSVETCERNRNHLFHETSAKINPSLPLKEYLPFSPTSSPHPTFPQVSTQKTHFLTLPPEETTSILTAVKRFSKTATITHAVHAAMVLTLLCPSFQQSPSPELSTFNSSCWFNGRRYLMPAEQISYIPPCQSFFPICFTDLQDLRLTKNPGREERRALMLRALEITMGQYLALKEERG